MVDDSYPLGFKYRCTARTWRSRWTRPDAWVSTWACRSWCSAEEDDLIGEGHGDEDVSALARIAKRRSVRP
jgi:hypothetical protein